MKEAARSIADCWPQKAEVSYLCGLLAQAGTQVLAQAGLLFHKSLQGSAMEVLPPRRQLARQAEAGLCFHFGLNLFALEWGHGKSHSVIGHPLSLHPPTADKFACGWQDGEESPHLSPRAHPSPWDTWGSATGGIPTFRAGRGNPTMQSNSKAARDGSGRRSHAGHGGLPALPPLLSAVQIGRCQVTQPAIVKTVNFSSECFN